MKVTRLIRKLSGAEKPRKAIVKKNPDILLKFEDVKQKIDGVWIRKTLVVKKSETSEFHLYLISNSAYTYYEVYNLSSNFVEQLYDNSSKKCQILLVEAAISLKFTTISEKWRMVEFLRANLANDSINTQGILNHRPNLRAKTGQAVQIYLKSTCLYIIDSKKSKIIAHVNLKLHVGFMGCVRDDLYFTKYHRTQINVENQDFWSIGVRNIETLWKKMGQNHRQLNLDEYYTFARIFKVSP